jgi:putative transposase
MPFSADPSRVSLSKPAIQENGAPRSLWHSRGYLPHFAGPDSIQHVTFHLADSLPKTALQRLDREVRILPLAKRDAERLKRIEAWIDAGYGSCLLRQPSIAECVQQSLLLFDIQRYRMLAWVVMPNHIHTLLQPINGWSVAQIVASWKKFTARRISRQQQQCGQSSKLPIWHREYWDRYIRNEQHFGTAMQYIHDNPVKAGLVTLPTQWPWSSAAREHALGTPISRLAPLNRPLTPAPQ